jgi:hypothetical protein
LNQNGHVNRTSAQDRRQSEYGDVKGTGIALELDCSAVGPTGASKEQNYAENEHRAHELL